MVCQGPPPQPKPLEGNINTFSIPDSLTTKSLVCFHLHLCDYTCALLLKTTVTKQNMLQAEAQRAPPVKPAGQQARLTRRLNSCELKGGHSVNR